jgi:hypothetical protein
MNVPRKYSLLRFIAFLLKLFAWLILLAGIAGTILGFVFVASRSGGNLPDWLQFAPLVGTILLPIVSIVWFVQFFAFGSILSLLIDIEQNTRLLAARTGAAPEA